MLRPEKITPQQLKVFHSFANRWHALFGSELFLLSEHGEIITRESDSLLSSLSGPPLLHQLASLTLPTLLNYQDTPLFIVSLGQELPPLAHIGLLYPTPSPIEQALFTWSTEAFISRLAEQNVLQDMTDELILAWNQLELIYHVTQNMAFQANLVASLKSVLQEIHKVIETADSFIILTHAQKREFIHLADPSPLLPYKETLFKLLVSQDKVILCNTATACQQYGADFPPFIQNLLGTSLTLLQEDTPAVLGLVNKTEGTFTASDAKLLAALAQQVGFLIKNYQARQQLIAHERLTREREIAAQIQTTLQPRQLPHMGGVSMAVSFVPSADVGGDFYDFITLDDQHMMLVIGDVSGHGVQTATLTTVTRTLLRAEILRGTEPHAVIDHVNHLLYHDLNQAEAIITLLVVLIDTYEGELKYANAGHVPALMWERKTRQTHPLTATTSPVGAFPTLLPHQTHRFALAAGDTLVLFTNGITEAQSPNQDRFGLHRLNYIVNYRASDPPEQLQQYILSEVAKFQRMVTATHSDDATLLVMKMLPQADAVTSKNISTIIKTVNYTYTADTNYLRQISQDILDVCREMPVLAAEQRADDFITLIELAISEICTNIMKHAYKGNKNGSINIKVTLLNNGVQFDFYDQGVGFDPNLVPVPQLDKPPTEGGYGLFIIRKIMDVVSYRHDPHEGNHWHMVKLYPSA